MFVNIGIADWAVTPDAQVKLITHSLGSCIAVSVWDPEMLIGGMIHYMLPDSAISPERAKESPAMFATTGVPALFRAAYELGARKNRLVVKVAGGSQLMDDNGTFNIGKLNYLTLRKIFWKNGIDIAGEDVGGSVSRTMCLDVGTGQVTLKTRSGETAL